jgi:mono/diheme cytochrome c family protein
LTSGPFKLRSTAPGSPPTDADLFATVTRGMPGSPMPSFAFLTDRDRRAVVQYVKSLSPTIAARGGRSIPVRMPPAPPLTPAAITSGKAVYARLQCAGCHGAEGRGDGPAASALRDEHGFPLRPRAFTAGVFKGGATSRDIYLRTVTGLDGTPMTAMPKGHATVTELWHLAYYIQSLRRAPAGAPVVRDLKDGVIVSVREWQGLSLEDPLSAVWDSAPAHTVPLNALSSLSGSASEMTVRSLNDGERIAFLLEWADVTPNTETARPQDFRDGAAIQFLRGDGNAFIGMGDRNTEVNIWHWKADWQIQVDRGKRRETSEVYPWMIKNNDPAPAASGREAGNLSSLAQRSTPVEDANARGFGTLTAKPVAQQRVMGRGVWSDGRWRVVFIRALAAPVDGFVNGQAVRVTFAVWDGARRDRAAQKAISTGYQLKVEGQ